MEVMRIHLTNTRFYFWRTAKLLQPLNFSLPIKKYFMCDLIAIIFLHHKQLLTVTSKSVCSGINMLNLIIIYVKKYTLTATCKAKAIESYSLFDESWRCEATWDTETVGDRLGAHYDKNIWLMLFNKWEFRI